jgi:hypothetical protein
MLRHRRHDVNVSLLAWEGRSLQRKRLAAVIIRNEMTEAFKKSAVIGALYIAYFK